MEYPFYQPHNSMATLQFSHNGVREVIETEVCDHYLKQVDAMANAILQGIAVPTPLTDALNNMRVIDAVFASHEQGGWMKV